jgi:hypothetical protein
MDKLKELLKGIGASEELTSAICEELERYSASLKANYDAEYKAKVDRAKKVCIEEVNKEKAALARKLKTFLESKAAAIDQAAARQRGIEESQSAVTLKKAKAVLEGVELKESGETNAKLQDAQKKAARLEKACATLKEERNLAIAKANTANGIAAKALQRNRILETKGGKPVTEGFCTDHHMPFPKDGKCAKCKGGDEGKKDDKKVDEARKPAPRRLDESRQVPAGAQATRRTLSESQSRQAAVQPATEIQKIASSINE